MSIFGFLSKKNTPHETPLKKKVREMKCRKVSFVDCDFDELVRNMNASSDYILSLTPVNYYAVKNQYILALIYTSEDYSENYVQFKRLAYEKQTDESGIYPLDKLTMSKALAKVGIILLTD
jgi:predicted ATPase